MAYKFNPFTGNFDDVVDVGGSTTQVQFNDGGVFGGDADLTWNKTTNVLTTKGDISLDDAIGGATTTLQTITPVDATFNASISGTTMTLTSAATGVFAIGQIISGSGVTAGTTINSLASGTIAASGSTYVVSASQTVSPAVAMQSGTNKVISLPNRTGTLALVAGSSSSLIYNNAGAYAGVPGATVGSSGNITLNASSGFTGNLLDLQLNGTSYHRFTHEGVCAFGTGVNSPTLPNAPVIGNYFGAIQIATGGTRVGVFTSAAGVSQGLRLDVGGLVLGASADLALQRDAANTLAQRNGGTSGTPVPQTYRIYNYLNPGNSNDYERGRLEWLGNEFRIGTEAGSSGSVRSLGLYSGSTRYQVIGSNYNQFDKDVYFNAANIVTGGAGFKIGTATTQKIGFYNATPVVQPAAVANATDADSVITQLNALLARMRELGLIAT